MASLHELEQAAAIMMAPPSMVTAEQRGAAEQIFTNFKKQKFPYAVCKSILEQCHNDYVLFQAASTIREAITNEWTSLSKQDIQSLQTFLLSFVIQRRSVRKYVQEQVLQVIAVMFKRGTVDPDATNRQSLLQDISKLMSSADTDMQLLGCSMLNALLTEYTSFKTMGGMSLEFHAKCKKAFETSSLQHFFKIIIQCLHTFSAVDLTTSQDQSLAVINRLLTLAETILNWEFASSAYNLHQMLMLSDSKKVTLFKPGPTWRQTVLDGSMMDLIFTFVCKSEKHSELLHHGYQCLIQLGSVTGAVFPNNPQSRVQYLSHYVQGLLQLTGNMVTQTHSSLLCISMCLNRSLIAFPIECFVAMPEQILQSCLAMMANLTRLCLQSASKESQGDLHDDDSTYTECVEELLEAWATILSNPDKLPVSSYANHAIDIFNCYVQCHLAPPHGIRGGENALDQDNEEIFEFEDDDRDLFEDQLCAIGMFARTVPAYTMPLLSKLLEEKTNQLQRLLLEMQAKQMTCPDASMELLYEDLHWLLLITGHVLVNTSPRETPIIPQQLNTYSSELSKTIDVPQTINHLYSTAAHGQQADNEHKDFCHIDPIVRLSAAVIKLSATEQHALMNNFAGALSPQLGQTLMWVLTRWTNVYLMPNESDYEEISLTLVSVFGEGTDCGKWLVKVLLEKVCSNLTSWGAETQLSEDTVQLLISLAKSKSRALIAVSCDGLWILARQYSANTPALSQLPQEVRKHLVRALILFGNPLENKEMQHKYWDQFFHQFQSRITSLCQQPDFSKKAQNRSVKNELLNLLESYCGVALACCSAQADYLYSGLMPVLEQAPALLELYKNHPEVVNLLLRVYVATAKVQLVYLGEAASLKFYELSLSLMQVYSKCNISKKMLSSLGDEDRYEDMLQLMKLLNNVLSKDSSFLFGDEDSDVNKVSPANTVLYGLNIIIPLITEELLKYPRLCNEYFDLVTNICELFPEKLNSLPPNLHNNFMFSLDLGLKRYGPDITKASLESIGSFASHEFKRIHNNGNDSAQASNTLRHFLKVVFELVLLDCFDMDLLQPAAEAFLPLICCQQAYYAQLVQELIMKQPNDNLKQRLLHAFNELTSNSELNLDRAHRTTFRKNLDNFLVDIRGFLYYGS